MRSPSLSREAFPHLNTHKINNHLDGKKCGHIDKRHNVRGDRFGNQIKRVTHNEEPIEEVIVIAAVSVVYKITEHRPKRHTAEDGKVTVRCSEAKRIDYFTAGRRRQMRTAPKGGALLTEAVFEIDPNDVYFRIAVRDEDGEHASTRGYWLDELVGFETKE